MDFSIPADPEDLLKPTSDGRTVIRNLTDVSALDTDEAYAFAEGAVYDICNNDALCVVEQAVFDPVFSLIRGFRLLQSVARRRLIDGLCSNLAVLCVSASALAQSAQEPEDRQQHDILLSAHRSALRAYIFLLHWIVLQMEQETRAEADMSAASASARTAKGGRKKAAAGRDLGTWDWAAQRERVMRAAAGVADLDLRKLFSPAPVDDALVQRWIRLALTALDSTAGAKSKDVRDSASRILGYAAAQLQQVEAIAGCLVDGLNRSEALAAAAAEVAQLACARFGDDRLAVELLRHVTAVDPGEYERQTAHNDSAGVRNVAVLVVDLAERMARTVATHMALLIPHLGGKAYPLRSAIVTAAGHLLVHAFSDASQHAPDGTAGGQSQANWLRAKQALLDLLTQRVRDQSAYTRARSLHTWALLADKCAIPLGHWMLVTQLAIGRLEDKAAIVRKAALQLLGALMHCNPFAPTLADAAFQASLTEYQAKLQELCPEEPEPSAGGGTDGEAARWEQGQVPVEGDGNEASAEDAEGSATSSNEDTEGQPDAAESSPRPAASEQDADAEQGTQQQSQSGENVEQLRHLVASLRVGTDFAKALSQALAVLGNLLGSATLSDVQETLSMVITCRQFQVTGVEALLRRMLLLMFAREQGVKDAVVDAFCQLYVQDQPAAAVAANLVQLACGASMGELSALEDLISQLMQQDKSLLSQQVLAQLWTLSPAASTHAADRQRDRARLAVIAMAAAWQPSLVADNLDQLLQTGFGSSAEPLVTRYACCALRHLSNLNDSTALTQQQLQPIHVALTQVLLDVDMSPEGWFSAAEAAIDAMFALHPTPQDLCGAVIRKLAGQALSGALNTADGARALELARLLFVVGHVALSQLVHIEASASAIRQKRAAADKAAIEAHSQGQAAGGGGANDEGEDIAAQLGLGSVANDLELDAAKEAAEAQIAAADGLIGRFAPLIACLCHHSTIRGVHEHLRAAALLALTKLMAVTSSYCDANLQLVFTLLHTRGVEASIRSNLVIALGDMAVRWPNVLEPWTAHMYQPLTDPDTGVRKNAVMVLSHLILNDMMKVKGHIARLALCLRDPEARVADLATLFFHELASKASKGSNPIYNLLPDMLSSLSAEPELAPQDFQGIMKTLLGYIGKDRQADALVDKLLPRFDGPSALSRNLAFCLSQLSFTEKGVRKVIDLFKLYQPALGDGEVLEVFKGITAKAKKLPKQSAELKGDLTSYEERLLEAAAAAEQAAEGAATNKEAEVSGMEVDTAAAEEAADESMAEANEPNTGDAEGQGEVSSICAQGTQPQQSDEVPGDAEDQAPSQRPQPGELPLTQEQYSEDQDLLTQPYEAASDPAARQATATADPAVSQEEEHAVSRLTDDSGAEAFPGEAPAEPPSAAEAAEKQAQPADRSRASQQSHSASKAALAGMQRLSLQERTNLPGDVPPRASWGQQGSSPLKGRRRAHTPSQQQDQQAAADRRRRSGRSTESQAGESIAADESSSELHDASAVQEALSELCPSAAGTAGQAQSLQIHPDRHTRSSVAAMRSFWEQQSS